LNKRPISAEKKATDLFFSDFFLTNRNFFD
jgi:hypothetical protein